MGRAINEHWTTFKRNDNWTPRCPRPRDWRWPNIACRRSRFRKGRPRVVPEGPADAKVPG